jgi:hypothetical protein
LKIIVGGTRYTVDYGKIAQWFGDLLRENVRSTHMSIEQSLSMPLDYRPCSPGLDLTGLLDFYRQGHSGLLHYDDEHLARVGFMDNL